MVVETISSNWIITAQPTMECNVHTVCVKVLHVQLMPQINGTQQLTKQTCAGKPLVPPRDARRCL
jgi:hypothetical protein